MHLLRRLMRTEVIPQSTPSPSGTAPTRDIFEDSRSERLLRQHAADQLSNRWFMGYGLNEPLPDHSSLAKIHTRYGIKVFRRLIAKY
jgi:hypothetical protein